VDDKPFTVLIVARGYEVDSNGHVAGPVLLQYGQNARWECLRDPGQAWLSVATAPEVLSLASCPEP